MVEWYVEHWNIVYIALALRCTCGFCRMPCDAEGCVQLSALHTAHDTIKVV